MGDLTKNFSRSEFACSCECGFDTVDIELLPAMQHMADHFSEKYDCEIWVDITGGNRCHAFNLTLVLKGEAAENSQHVFARANDFKVFKVWYKNGKKKRGKQINSKEVADFFDEHYYHFGIGVYKNRNHVDSRSTGKARWTI